MTPEARAWAILHEFGEESDLSEQELRSHRGPVWMQEVRRKAVKKCRAEGIDAKTVARVFNRSTQSVWDLAREGQRIKMPSTNVLTPPVDPPRCRCDHPIPTSDGCMKCGHHLRGRAVTPGDRLGALH